jgi:tetratricopeptide (TPR) repeat protein
MEFIKQFIILLLIVLVGLGVYFGAFLPLGKSQRFIDAQTNIRLVQSTEQLKALYDVPLNFSSPIGQEEVVKFVASTVGDILAQENIPEEVGRWLVAYIDPYLFKNELRHLMLRGNMYAFLWEKYGNEEDFKKAEEALLAAHNIGPKTPPILYRLLDLYAKKGDEANARKYAELIISYWPQDEKVRAFLNN